MKKFLFGPVKKILDERQAIIEKDLSDANSAKEDAETMKEEYVEHS